MDDQLTTVPKLARQSDITRRMNADQRKARTCERCGIGFIEGSLSRKQREAGHRQQYCSNACRAKAQALYATKSDAKRAEYDRALERKGLQRWEPVERACPTCGDVFLPSHSLALSCSPRCGHVAREVAKHPERRELRLCKECGQTFHPSYASHRRMFCSEQCQGRHNGRVGKMVRRARERSTKIERVDPMLVFERDGWTCQICGEATPRLLRGSLDRMAPELDHVHPLARGGAHTYANTQCACRSCNGRKGDSLPEVA